jgi:hypothetical protein
VRSRIIEFLPDLYQNLLPEFFERPLAEERHATCHQCAMCPPPVPDLPRDAYFSPSTKCCTYHPTLPNYSVGGLLLDMSDAGREGRRRIQEKIARRVGVTPFGILPPPRFRLLMTHGRKAFGQAEGLLCPYFDRDTLGCTVWAMRESECTTWFCKHTNGQDGRLFWRQLSNYLIEMQKVLASAALRELGFDADKILAGVEQPPAQLDARAIDDLPLADSQYQAMWGQWTGREEELYTSAFRFVAALDRPAYIALAGLRHDLLLAALAKRHDAITNPMLPDPMIKNPTMQFHPAPDGSYMLITYGGYDPTRLRKPVYDLLDLFDGRRSTAEVRAEAQAQTGLRLADSFLISLYQHRILVAPGSTTYETARD